MSDGPKWLPPQADLPQRQQGTVWTPADVFGGLICLVVTITLCILALRLAGVL